METYTKMDIMNVRKQMPSASLKKRMIRGVNV